MRGFRIVLAAHGDLAAAFLASAELIVGSIADARAVGLDPDQTTEAYAAVLRDAVGDGPCLILADLVGGTPANCARVVARGRADVVVLAGLTLGVLIEASISLPSLADEAIDALVAAGREGIVAASPSLVGRQTP